MLHIPDVYLVQHNNFLAWPLDIEPEAEAISLGNFYSQSLLWIHTYHWTIETPRLSFRRRWPGGGRDRWAVRIAISICSQVANYDARSG